jgi:hypothetical protein
MTIFRDVLFSLSFALGAVAAAKFVMCSWAGEDRGQSIKGAGRFVSQFFVVLAMSTFVQASYE